jgi:hypothetical protein
MKQTNKALKAKIESLELDLSIANKKYQGYENAETMNAALMINQNRGDYEHYRALYQECLQTAKFTDNVKSGIWTVKQSALYSVEDKMKEDYSDLLDQAVARLRMSHDLYKEILRVAFQGINWQEVAEHITME